MNYIACDVIIGYPRVIDDALAKDTSDLLGEMDRLGIDSAIVRHESALWAGPQVGNQKLLEDIRGQKRLMPAYFVTPDGFEPEFSPALMVEQMLAHGSYTCWCDPKAELFSIQPWCSAELYAILQERRIPLILDYTKFSPDDLHIVLSEFAELRIIVLNAPRLGRNRMLYPLLRRHANLYLCLSNTYSVHLGYEDLCTTFGHERWVFGMGYPGAEPGAAIAGLMYANLSDEAKQAIARANIERLLGEVR